MVRKSVNQVKKSVIFMLILLLAISQPGFGKTTFATTESSNLLDLTSQVKGNKVDIQANSGFEDEDEVRVIVELEGDPAIIFAQNKGIRYKDLTQTKKVELNEDIAEEQTDLLSQLQKKRIELDVENQFSVVVNGISGKMKFGDIEDLESLSSVASVHIATKYERPEPEMNSSGDIVQAAKVWESVHGYKGEGMVVGIIDSGIDPWHRDMILTDDSTGEITEAEVEELRSGEKQLPGKYFTAKVPYGYNYIDKNDEIRDLGPGTTMHGMHVAGTVGANGDEANGGIKGIAPEAQLLALKVFGNDVEMESTYGDIYIKAIDDAIALGADVLNMSLGATAGFVDSTSPEQQAIKRAVDNGVMMSISGGNSAYLGVGWDYPPYASNPDIGVVGSPGLSYESLQVASLENSHIKLGEIAVTVGDEELSIGYQAQDTPPFGNSEIEAVYVEDGQKDKYEGKDVTGKVVFVVRTGDFFYAQIQAQAEAAGAAGVIVRGKEAHGDYVNMSLENPTIPMASLSIADGNMLEEKILNAGGSMLVTFTGELVDVPNTQAGYMSDFSSWGLTPNLDFKPEITAPGGMIYSTLNADEYGVKSGTSMAAPHVSGGSALVLQRVEEEFDLENADKVNMAKNILMNTATPVEDPEGSTVYSPRRQGAGLMQLLNAMNTPVVVTEKNSNEAKVAMQEVGDMIKFTLTATNYSDSDVTYEVTANALTDLVLSDAEGQQYNVLTAQNIDDAHITISEESVTIPANDSADIHVTIDVSEADAYLSELMENGYFVEGFVTFTNNLNNEDDQLYPELTVPYVGFHGDWNAAPIVDGTIYDGEETFYDITGLYGGDDFLGFDFATNSYMKEKIAFSPNSDGVHDTVTPVVSLLRNTSVIEFSVLNAEMEKLRTIRTDNNFRKHYYNNGNEPFFIFDPTTSWDGYANLERVPDGLYYYQIKTQIDYAGEEEQLTQIPIFVDTISPEITSVEYDEETLNLVVEGEDSGIGIHYYGVIVDGGEAIIIPYSEDGMEYVFDTAPEEGATIDVVAIDYAGNAAIKTLFGAGDETVPGIVATSPGSYVYNNFYTSLDMVVSGYVTDASEVFDLTLTGDAVVGSPVSIQLQWNEEQSYYDFNTPISFKEDGIHEIRIAGEDTAGNEIDFLREVLVDTSAPIIDVSGLPEDGYVDLEGADPVVTVSVTENFDQLRFYFNESEEFYDPFEETYMQPITMVEDYELNLVEGHNTFAFEAVDVAGNVTTKTVSIYKGENPPDAQIEELSIDPKNNVSTHRPVTIAASSTESISWDVKLIDPTGAEIALPADAGTTYTTTFVPDEFTVNGLYEVVVTGSINDQQVNEITDTFEVYNYPIKIKSVDVLNEAGEAATTFTQSGKVRIKANIENLGPNAESPLVIIQVKDDQDVVVDLSFFTIDQLIDGASNGFGSELQLSNLDKGTYSIDVFVWDDWNSPSALSEASKGIATFTVE
ncbi:S8 family serine peptidase [Cytobacillus sp. IB215316]|uniref:S8 family serine peptidase n=1 Tax=Cytobacillus sp. IB215316 TaxID=3097354 RepID=UPI002A10B960|nr:S8 family serine peptidase [Cytobacillus sp. IB215316]MDX8361149.1 S8 family serine peptidase [Cytobacillus sp. IB215316]